VTIHWRLCCSMAEKNRWWSYRILLNTNWNLLLITGQITCLELS